MLRLVIILPPLAVILTVLPRVIATLNHIGGTL